MKRMILGWLAAGILAGPLVAQAAVVTVGNREWRQLTETTGFTWNQVANVCKAADGYGCSGTLGAVSFDGWTWANNIDIQGLFKALIPSGDFPNEFSDYTATGNPPDSDEIAAFVGPGFFDPTRADASGRILAGLSRDSASVGTARGALLIDFLRPSPSADLAYLSQTFGSNESSTLVGVWLYKDLAPVPLPAAAYLFASGLVGLLGLARRRSGKAAAV